MVNSLFFNYFHFPRKLELTNFMIDMIYVIFSPDLFLWISIKQTGTHTIANTLHKLFLNQLFSQKTLWLKLGINMYICRYIVILHLSLPGTVLVYAIVIINSTLFNLKISLLE